jgi:integrase
VNGSWSFVLYLGMQSAQRCPACTEAKRPSNRWWLGAERREDCPNCGAELRATREPRQMTEGGFSTRHDAELARAKAVQRLGRGRYVPPERMSLGEYLRDRWLPAVMASGLKMTTKQGYASHVKYHLIGPPAKPHPLGLVELRKLSLGAIRDHYRGLMAGYVVEDVLRDGHGHVIVDKTTRQPKRGLVERRGLSLETIKRVQAALHGALKEAVELGMLDHNPATGAVAKKKLGNGDALPRELPAWSVDELEAFLDAQEAEPLYPLWRFLALTGLRRGEALALKWGDVDLDAGRVTVSRNRVPLHGGEIAETATKTDRVRVVDLDPETIDVLRAMRRRGLVVTLDDRDVYVFTDDAGEPLGPNSVSYLWRKAVRAAGMRHIPLHGLRHTHISQLVSEGQPIAMVAARAGHSTPNVTLGTYSHYLPGQQQSAVASMARYSRKGSA